MSAVAIGLLLILASVGIRWIAAPRLALLPSDTDTTRIYEGTAAALINAKALTSADAGPVLLTHVPITLTHRTVVLDTKGHNALVSDTGSVRAAGSPVAGFDYRYAVDRSSMARGSGFDGVVSQTGVTFNFPIRTAKHDYPGWVPDTQSAVPLTYKGTAKRGGLSTYVFRTSSKPTLITDPQTLKALPASLPKATAARLAESLGLSAAQLNGLANALSSLPDPVPFSYTYRVVATYWVEPTTGEIVDLREREIRTLALKVGATLVPITPVLDISYTSEPADRAAAVADARHDASKVNLVYRTLPLILLVIGILLLLGGGVGLLLGRRRPQSTPPRESASTPSSDQSATGV
ncbi:MAG TPA: porin PorA family protein [Mycobacterium sp.]|nr:porin PorA family protein [Mycobacterium sp.]